MMRTITLVFASALSALPGVVVSTAWGQLRSRPNQYAGDTIRIPPATVDEPKVKAFNAETIRKAARYLEDGALAWKQSYGCVSCHTTGTYMVESPGLAKYLGPPNKDVLQLFRSTIPDKVPEPDKDKDLTYFRTGKTAVWRTIGLAEYDKHMTGTLSNETERSLRDMLLLLASHGGHNAFGQVEIPYNTSDLEISIQAIRALVAAPGYLANLKDRNLLDHIDKLKTFVRETKPRNNYESALKLKLALLMPELVEKKEVEAAVEMLWTKQLPDGSWSTRRMADTRSWRTPMTARVIRYIEALPDAKAPGGDLT